MSVARAPMAAMSITSVMVAGSMMSATIGAMIKVGGFAGSQRRPLCDRANYGSNISKGHRCRRKHVWCWQVRIWIIIPATITLIISRHFASVAISPTIGQSIAGSVGRRCFGAARWGTFSKACINDLRGGIWSYTSMRVARHGWSRSS